MIDPGTVPPLEPEEERAVVELLSRARPAPPAPFRRTLAQRLARQDPGWGPRPDRLWPAALGLLGAGALLVVLGALVAVGGI